MYNVIYVTTASVEGAGHGTRRPPLVTAGVALVGAGLVIVTPVKAAVPDIVEVASVQLTSSR
jgi:hypothetical protein